MFNYSLSPFYFHLFFPFFLLLAISSTLWQPCQGNPIPEKPMVIVIPSYNNIQWYEANLTSIFTQKYTNYRCIYINDQSTDGTGEAVRNYLDQRNIDYQEIFFDDRLIENLVEKNEKLIQLIKEVKCPFILVHNLHRCSALANLYRAIYSCQNDEIIVTVDGDDWLYGDQVLKELNEIYSLRDIWFTHGRLIEYPSGIASWCEPVPPEIIQDNEFRKFKCPSHLRTFYTWLFKKIKLEDFLYKGNFFTMAWDMAIMYPIAEMAGFHQAFISQVNYVYNMANQINDNKVDPQLQRDLDQFIRNRPPYMPLEKADFEDR
jgi:glycosyltransferase involved in cell wall biosynthesis